MKKYFNKIAQIIMQRLNIKQNNHKESYYQYAEKVTNALMGIVFTIVCCILIYFIQVPDGKISKLERPESGTQVIELEVTNEKQGYSQKVDIDISAPQYTQDKASFNLDKADEYIRNNILSTKNQNQNSITQDIMLTKQIMEYDVTIDWYSSDYSILDYDGKVYNQSFEINQKVPIQLTAKCKCQGYTKEFVYNVIVCQPILDEQVRNQKSIVKAIIDADSNTQYEDYVELPYEINGEKVSYNVCNDNDTIIVFVVGVLVTIMLVVNVDVKTKKKKESREKQLRYIYSEVISKLTLLLGAGMSVSMAWEKMVKDYLSNDSNYKKQYAYEEMKISYYQMKSGVPEGKVYMDFGQRCGIKEYIKLGGLLEQNIKKGTKGLSKLLEEEVENAFIERKNLASKLGEEAGTKLLLPMIIMLMIVMAIVMVPSMMSFSI